MDNERYELYSSLKEQEFEGLCKCCGECCGVLDAPCQNLVTTDNGRCFCKKYDDRFGPQKTVSGKEFNCVSIREHIGLGTLRPNCSYRLGS